MKTDDEAVPEGKAKWYEFNMRRRFLAHKRIYLPLICLLFLIGYSSGLILSSDDYTGFCGLSNRCYRAFFSSFLEDFNFPIKVAAATIALLLVQIAIYRSRQDYEQLKLFQRELETVERESKRQAENTLLTNYFSHKDYFRREMKDACDGAKWYDDLTVSRLHSALFPGWRSGVSTMNHSFTMDVRNKLQGMQEAATLLEATAKKCYVDDPTPSPQHYAEFLEQLIETCRGLYHLRAALGFPEEAFKTLLILSVPVRAFDAAVARNEMTIVIVNHPTQVMQIRNVLSEISRLLLAAIVFQEGLDPVDPAKSHWENIRHSLDQVQRSLESIQKAKPQKPGPFGLFVNQSLNIEVGQVIDLLNDRMTYGMRIAETEPPHPYRRFTLT